MILFNSAFLLTIGGLINVNESVSNETFEEEIGFITTKIILVQKIFTQTICAQI